MLRRKFTALENMLLLVSTLVFLACFYYWILLKPVLAEVGENRLEASLLQEELNIQLELAGRKNRMLEQLKHPPQKLSGELLPYDNAKYEMRELDVVLKHALTYDISAGTPVKADGIVRRAVHIVYETDSYEQAAEIVKTIEDGPYRCLVSDVEMILKENGPKVETDLTVTYFELDPDEGMFFDDFDDRWYEMGQ